MELINPIKYGAELTGAPEAALALIVALFSALPLSLIYLWLLSKSSPVVKHFYFILCGLALLYINYGHELLYVLSSVVVTWVLLIAFGPTKLQAGLNFVFNMGFLLVAYRIYETEDYDINWTTAQCVMCLRNIGIVFDYYDGSKKGKTDNKGNDLLVSDQLKNYVETAPSLLEMFGYSLFFPAVLVGPQITFRHFREYVAGHVPGTGDRPTRRQHVIPGLVSFMKGIMFMAAYQLLEPYVPHSYYFSDEFFNEITVWDRLFFMWKRSFPFFYRYFACWLMAEGACILSGVAYMGRHKDGKFHWGLHNIYPWAFTWALSLQGIIASFNINTNFWVMRIVFKRLRWLGNKHLSQFGALMFLAIWHGFHYAYFYAFALEFFEIFGERSMQSWLGGVIEWANSPRCPRLVYLLLVVVAWLFRTILLANGVMSFDILSIQHGWKVMHSMLYIPHLVALATVVIPMVLPKPMRKPRKEKEEAATKKEN